MASNNSSLAIDAKVSPTILTWIGIYLTLATVIGGMANALSLYVFYTEKKLRTRTNYFIISLLFCDLCMCTIFVPMAVVSNYAYEWLFGWIGCVFHGFGVYFFGLTNLYILTAISVERYLSIARPHLAKKISHRVVGFSILLCFFFGFVWSIMPMLGWSSYAFEGAGTSCVISVDSTDRSALSYNITICINCYLIPMWVMVFCYYYVYKTVRSTSNSLRIGENRIARRKIRKERKLLKTISIMIGVYLFAWTPYAVTAFWEAFGFGDLPTVASTIPAIFAKSASVWNPFIYVFTNNSFRIALYKIIPCRRLRQTLVNRENNQETVMSGTTANFGQISTITPVPRPTPKASFENNSLSNERMFEASDVDKTPTTVQTLALDSSSDCLQNTMTT